MANSQRSVAAIVPLWLVILSTGAIVGIAMGRAQSMGLYLTDISKALGVGREPFAFAMALSQLLMGLGAPFSGALIDKHGAGRVIAACVGLTIAGLACFAWATAPWHLWAGGVLMGLGVSGTGVTSLVGVVGRLVPADKRVSAIASIGMAAGIGGFVSLPLIHFLIEVFGWQQSLHWLMGITFLMLPLAWPISGAPAPPPDGVRQQTLGEALREAASTPSYWLLVAGFFVCGFHVAFIMVHLPAFVVDKGMPSWVGPFALSVVGIANIVGTYLAGQSAKYVEKRLGLSLIYLARAVLFLGFLFLPLTPTSTIVLCGVLGLFWLATIPLTSGLVATFFGTTWMSMLFGIVFLSHQIGSFIGVWLGGRLFDLTRSYDTMWWLSVALGVIATLLHWPIRERPVARLHAQAA
jgi:predicted MFS family arabinose efflux permease